MKRTIITVVLTLLPVVATLGQALNLNSDKVLDKGDMFVDFPTTTEVKDSVAHFSDYIGRGQYVLVDFWASWCPPCRMLIPHLIERYNQYKDKGFVVLGVSVDRTIAEAQTAIKNLKIPYPQLYDLKGISARLYSYQYIPTTILFAPDGTIVARDVTEQLDELLQGIYGE
ncbi:MAG: TlpA family protein disulfide reductase [Bacteroidaceae bacterium]|nr:TlpA family protein disulfide reductase [Bacteroidaceae bacterium]